MLLLQREPTWPGSNLLLRWDRSSKVPAGFSSCLGYLQVWSCGCCTLPVFIISFEFFLFSSFLYQGSIFLVCVAWTTQGRFLLSHFDPASEALWVHHYPVDMEFKTLSPPLVGLKLSRDLLHRHNTDSSPPPSDHSCSSSAEVLLLTWYTEDLTHLDLLHF